MRQMDSSIAQTSVYTGTGWRLGRHFPKHEKIRFRREERAALHGMPSATETPPVALAHGPSHRLVLLALKLLAVVAVLVIVGAGLVYPLAVAGLGSEQLRSRAEAMISTLTGEDIRAEIGKTSLSLDRSLFIGFEVEDVSAVRRASGTPVLEAGSITFGVELLPLLTGSVVLGNARIADASFDLDAIPAQGTGSWDDGLTNPDGLIDPGRVIDAIFAGAQQAFRVVDERETSVFELENIAFMRTGEGGDPIAISHAAFSKTGHDTLALDADISLERRIVHVEGTARRQDGRIDDLALTVDLPQGDIDAAETAPLLVDGAATIRLNGRETTRERLIDAEVSLTDARLRTGDDETLAGSVSLMLSATNLEDQIQIGASHVAVGRSRVDFSGVAGTIAPDHERGRAETYGVELVSRRATVAPEDSPEPALSATGRLILSYEPATRKLHADSIEIYTGSGEAIGKAVMDFADTRSPGLTLALSVPAMPIAHAKQLWPVFSAPSARRWVMSNVFGGMVRDSSLNIDLAAGRMTDDLPMAAEEGFGQFNLEGARFDVAGKIPAVRDAIATVDFRGTDVDISLTSGTAYLNGGRSVAAGPGTFAIRNSHRSPVVGKLELDVAGDADAIVELAGYEPIDASRFIEMGPDSFAGAVNGHVSASIPLEADVESEDIGWRVDLAYDDLEIDKPIAGQMVSAATGTIVIDPERAVIAASARLNGIPADLAIVEPFDGDEAKRERKIDLILDNKARKELFPGLDDIVAGPVTVAVDTLDDGRQAVVADASRAVLSIPWIGWEKGAGVPATVTFTMREDDNTTLLADFTLKGESFQVKGDVLLDGDAGFKSADFTEVRLNRGDDVSAKIVRSGRGFNVTIRGKSFDGRSLIKLYGADGDGDSTGGGTAIAVDAKVDRLSGFGGETMSGVVITYEGDGSRAASVAIQANTTSGTPVTVSDRPEADRRVVRLSSTDAGAVLRFLDLYEHMRGGTIDVVLAGKGGGLAGQIDARNFIIENEPRLKSLVAAAPAPNQPSLNQAAKRQINTSRARFDRAFAMVDKSPDALRLERGVIRGAEIGATFQGMLYDANGRISMTGTFMPAYGINRMFGEIPLIGQILGNGRERGLFGITYKLTGDAKNPQLQVNPISAIAPGIFRSIFEFR